MNSNILIGNSFPLSLIRRKVVIRPCTIDELCSLIQGKRIVSFWGHRNTLDAAGRILGADLTPAAERPALSLSPEKLPMFDGECFSDCWILSPDYKEGFRPSVGEEVAPEQILGWQCLHMHFPDDPSKE